MSVAAPRREGGRGDWSGRRASERAGCGGCAAECATPRPLPPALGVLSSGPPLRPGFARAPAASAPRGGARPWPGRPRPAAAPSPRGGDAPGPRHARAIVSPASARWDPAFLAERASAALRPVPLGGQPCLRFRRGAGAGLLPGTVNLVGSGPRRGTSHEPVLWCAALPETLTSIASRPQKTFGGGLSLAFFLPPPRSPSGRYATWGLLQQHFGLLVLTGPDCSKQ